MLSVFFLLYYHYCYMYAFPSITIKLGRLFTLCCYVGSRKRGILFCMFINHKEIYSIEFANKIIKYQILEQKYENGYSIYIIVSVGKLGA